MMNMDMEDNDKTPTCTSNELKKKHIGCHHDSPDEFVKSQVSTWI